MLGRLSWMRVVLAVLLCTLGAPLRASAKVDGDAARRTADPLQVSASCRRADVARVAEDDRDDAIPPHDAHQGAAIARAIEPERAVRAAPSVTAGRARARGPPHR